METLIVYLPFFLSPLFLVAPLLLLIDPSFPFLSVSVIHRNFPQKMALAPLYAILGTIDVLFLSFLIAVPYFVVFCMLFFMLRIQEDVNHFLQLVRSQRWVDLFQIQMKGGV
jgi:hypothetical protein